MYYLAIIVPWSSFNFYTFPVPFWIRIAQNLPFPKGGVAMCWNAHYFYMFYLMYAIFSNKKCFFEIEVFCFGSLDLRLFLPTFTQFSRFNSFERFSQSRSIGYIALSPPVHIHFISFIINFHFLILRRGLNWPARRASGLWQAGGPAGGLGARRDA